MIRIIVVFLLFILPVAAGAASLAERFAPGMSYYFDYFEPGQRPWAPGRHLNIEEVFKNYEYYEIEFDEDGKGIMANHYVRGSKADSERHLILPDGSLRRREP